MDWIRRNWPDLLIGIALFSVITGIVATLLSGGTILPTSSGNVNNDFETEPSPSYLSSVTAVDEPTNASARYRSETIASSENSSQITVVQPSQTLTTPEPRNVSSRSVITDSRVASSTLSPVVAPRETPANITDSSSDSSDLGVTNLANSSGAKIYKISVGAFSNPDNARKLVGEVDSLGYKAGLDKSGSYSVVYVGPFSSRQQADRVAEQLKASSYEASIYSEETSQPVAIPVATTPAATPVTTPVATTNSVNQVVAAPNSSAIPTSGNFYLQVGAYRSGNLSIPQRNQLEQLGYKVMEYRENGFVKLMLGPYTSDSVATIKAELAVQGIDSFPRNLAVQ